MAKMARQEVFSPDEIACVHVMNRAVRQCFLMGDDPVSGKNFDHRKLWMETKLEIHAAVLQCGWPAASDCPHALSPHEAAFSSSNQSLAGICRA